MEEDEQTSKGEESRLTLIINPGNGVENEFGKDESELLTSEDWRLEIGG